MIVFYVFFGLVLIRLVAIVIILLVALSVGPQCPACGREAILIRTPWLRLLSNWIERRWCMTCGWQGLTRRSRSAEVQRPRVEADRFEPRRTAGP